MHSLPHNWEHYTHHAMIMGREAAKISLKHFRHVTKITNKNPHDYDPVTEIDCSIERMWRSYLEKHFPQDGIHGEEYPSKKAMPHHPTWVLDPLDGTRSYIVGSLFWGHLIGLNWGGRAVLGAINAPITGEEFFAHPQGVWQQKKDGKKNPLKTSSCLSIENARMGCTTPDLFTSQQEKDIFETIKAKARLCIFGGNFYSYCLLAMGHIDIIIESSLAKHDVQATIPIVRAAGGRISDWEGNLPEEGGKILACATEKLHKEALHHIRCQKTFLRTIRLDHQ